MEVEEYLGRSRLFQRLKSGPHGQPVERFAARLVEDGLVRHGTWRCLNVVGGLLSWMAGRRWALAALDERMCRAIPPAPGWEADYPARRPGRAQAMAVGAA